MYLARVDLKIPDDVMFALSQINRSSLQRLEFDLRTGLRRKKSVGTQIAIAWLGFKRYADPDAGRFQIAQLPSYLKRTWRAGSIWNLPMMAVRKGVRRLFLNPAD